MARRQEQAPWLPGAGPALPTAQPKIRQDGLLEATAQTDQAVDSVNNLAVPGDATAQRRARGTAW